MGITMDPRDLWGFGRDFQALGAVMEKNKEVLIGTGDLGKAEVVEVDR